MPASFWRRIEERAEQREADEERKRIARWADWVALRDAFQEQLRELGAPRTLTFRSYELSASPYPEEFAWWEADRVEENEAALLAADQAGDVRLVHLHGGRAEGNPALTTLRLIDRADEEGEAPKVAMLVRALLHYRQARSYPPLPEDLLWRAIEACWSVHRILRELTWAHGSKDVLPHMRQHHPAPANLKELGRQLGDYAAALLTSWVPVRVRQRSVLVQKSEAQ